MELGQLLLVVFFFGLEAKSLLTLWQAVRSLIHGSLNKVEAVHSHYTAALSDASSPTDPRIHEVRVPTNLF